MVGALRLSREPADDHAGSHPHNDSGQDNAPAARVHLESGYVSRRQSPDHAVGARAESQAVMIELDTSFDTGRGYLRRG